jgi:hypothetical protein
MKKILLLLALSPAFLFAQLPSYAWHAAMGSNYADQARSIAVDASGNTYVAGIFSTTIDFEPGPGITTVNANGGYDFFVLKLDSTGNLLWVKDFGSNSSIYDEEANDLVLDANNNIYITGSFRGQIDFDPGPAVYNMSSGGGLGYGSPTMFILKLSTNGDFKWARCPGTYMGNSGASITVDNGAVYTTGSFAGDMDLSMGSGSAIVNNIDQNDIFLVKLDTIGNYLWGKAIGGTEDQNGKGVAVYGGDIFITGVFKDTVDFDPGAGTAILSANASNDLENAFICKFNASGNLTWAKQIGDNPFSNVQGSNLTIDNTGNVYLTGNYRGAVDFDPGAGTQIDSNFRQSIYAVKVDNNGNLIWYNALRAYSNSSVNQGNAIALDASNNVYLTGTFHDSIDTDGGVGVNKLVAIEYTDIFMVKLDANGNHAWGEQLGGTNNVYDIDAGFDLQVAGNEIYFAGTFENSLDCDPGFGTVTATGNGWNDMLIIKFGQNNTGIIENSGIQISFLLYPNPAENAVYLQVEGLTSDEAIQFQIIDLTGKMLQQKLINAQAGSNQFTIDLANLANGIYMLRLQVSGKWFTRRFIKA